MKTFIKIALILIMEKYFVTYNQSLALKELGFDEPCFGYYDGWNGQTHLIVSDEGSNRFLVKLFNLFKKNENQTYNQDYVEYLTGICTAPLKSQVFEWFRNEHGLNHMIDINFRTNNYITQLWRNRECLFNEHSIKTYEEAESACIDKLIEIIKNDNRRSTKGTF